jgi:hypothetical protein
MEKAVIDASWIIVRRDTGEAVLETYDFEAVQFVNLSEYRVQTALGYLQEFNARASASRY